MLLPNEIPDFIFYLRLDLYFPISSPSGISTTKNMENSQRDKEFEAYPFFVL